MVDFTPTGIAAGTPTLGSPTFGQTHLLGATGFAAGTPTLGSPAAAADRFIWPFRSMLGRPFNVRREYRTEIFTSRSGREQRRALRQTPRKRIAFDVSLIGDDWRNFRRSMVRDLRRKLISYEAPRFATLAAEMAGGDECEVTAAAAWLRAGQAIMLIDDARMAHRTIRSVVGTTVTFTGSGLDTWPAGTKLHAALDGRLAADVATAVRYRHVTDVQVSFEATPGSELEPLQGTAAATFNDREVLLSRPNVWMPVEVLHEQLREAVDYGHGTIATFHPVTFTAQVRQGAYYALGLEAADALQAFFDRMKGQRGEFYMPSFEDDLPLAAIAGSGTTSLTVTGTDVAEIFAGSTVYEAIAVFLTDGTVLYNRVTDIEESAGNSLLTVATAWGQDIAPAGVTRISWMPVWRLASDIMEIEWDFDTLARTSLAMRMLEDLAPEVDA